MMRRTVNSTKPTTMENQPRTTLAQPLPRRAARAEAGLRDRPRHVPRDARAQRQRAARLLFRPLALRRRMRFDVRRAGRRATTARRRGRRPSRRLPAERSAGLHRRARDLEVRRRRRAVQPDAARARARQDPAQLRLPGDDLPGGSLRRRRPGGAARDGRAAHDHDFTARVLGIAASPCRRCWPESGATATPMPSTCSRSSRSHAGERPRAVELTGDDVAFMVHTSGTTGDAKGAMNTHRNVVFATSVYEAWIGLTSEDVILGLAPLFHVTGLIGHVTLAMLTGSPLVLFYRFDANEACRLAATASRDVHGLRDHGVHRAAEQRRAREVRLEGADEALHGRRADAGERARGLARPHRRAHPADVRPHGGDVADAHDAARRYSADRSAYRRDVDRRARLQHARQGHDGRGPRSGPREIGEFVIAGPQIVPGLLAEARGDGEGADVCRAQDRRRRLHGRERLVLSRRPLEGHDHRVGVQGLAARGRRGALSAPGRPRSGRRRHSGRRIAARRSKRSSA